MHAFSPLFHYRMVQSCCCFYFLQSLSRTVSMTMTPATVCHAVFWVSPTYFVHILFSCLLLYCFILFTSPLFVNYVFNKYLSMLYTTLGRIIPCKSVNTVSPWVFQKELLKNVTHFLIYFKTFFILI